MMTLKNLLAVGNNSEAFLEEIHKARKEVVKKFTATIELSTVLGRTRSDLLRKLQGDGLQLPLQQELDECSPVVRQSEEGGDLDRLIELVGLIADHATVKNLWVEAQNGPLVPRATSATPANTRAAVRTVLRFDGQRTPVSEEKASHKGGALLAAACERFQNMLEELLVLQDADDFWKAEHTGAEQPRAEQKDVRHVAPSQTAFDQVGAALKLRFKLGAIFPVFKTETNKKGISVGKSVEDFLDQVEQSLKIAPGDPVGDMKSLLLALLERFFGNRRDMLKSLRIAPYTETASTYSYMAACMSGCSFSIDEKAEQARCKEVKSNSTDNVADVVQSLESFRCRIRELDTMTRILRTGMKEKILAEKHVSSSNEWIKEYILREILVDNLYSDVKGIDEQMKGLPYIDEVLRILGLRKTAQRCQPSPTKQQKKDKEDKAKIPKTTRKVDRRNDSSSESEEEEPKRKKSRRGESRQTGPTENKATEDKSWQEQPKGEWVGYTVDGRRICWFNNTTRGCVKGDECDFVHDDTAPHVGSTGATVCWDFDSRGYCRFGDSCRFEHTDKGHAILREWEAQQPAPPPAAPIPSVGLHEERREMVQNAAKGGGKGGGKGGSKGGGKGGKSGGKGKGGGKNRT